MKGRQDDSSAKISPPSVCLIFKKAPDEAPGAEEKRKRDEVHGLLTQCGLFVSISENSQQDECFFLVSAPDQVLKYEAEKMQMKLRLKSQHGGAFAPYERRLESLFEISSEGVLFPSMIQCRIIESIMRAPKKSGGAELDIDALVDEGLLADCFYMHYEPARKSLYADWVSKWTNVQPIDRVREYFGEKVALYFGWLGFAFVAPSDSEGHYTSNLWILAIVGGMLSITQLITNITTGSIDNPWVPLYCVFVAVWCTRCF